MRDGRLHPEAVPRSAVARGAQGVVVPDLDAVLRSVAVGAQPAGDVHVPVQPEDVALGAVALGLELTVPLAPTLVGSSGAVVLADLVLAPVATHGARLRVGTPVAGVVVGAEEQDQLQLESHPLFVFVVSFGPCRQHGDQGGVVDGGLGVLGGTSVGSVQRQCTCSISRSSTP